MDEIFDFLAKPRPEFDIGQRVRVKTMLAAPAMRAMYIGKEGHITGKGLMTGVWSGQVGYFVEIRGRMTLQFTATMLEPIVPDGAKPGSWDGLPWKPTD